MTTVAERHGVLRRGAVAVLAVFAVGIFPWTIYLTYALPSDHLATHWAVAWAGFDVAMGLCAAATALALWRHHPRLGLIAAATGTLLVCDAWFDTVTAGGGDELLRAGVLAALGELPLAALCFWLAWEADRARSWAPPRLRRPRGAP